MAPHLVAKAVARDQTVVVPSTAPITQAVPIAKTKLVLKHVNDNTAFFTAVCSAFLFLCYEYFFK